MVFSIQQDIRAILFQARSHFKPPCIQSNESLLAVPWV